MHIIYNEKQGDFFIQILFFKFRFNKKEKKIRVKKIVKKKKAKKARKDIRGLLPQYIEYIKCVLSGLKGRIVAERLDFYYMCGFGDAAKTAIIYGIVSGAAYNLYAFLNNNFKVKSSNISVTPDFTGDSRDIRFTGIFTLRIVYIMYIALKIIKIYLSNK